MACGDGQVPVSCSLCEEDSNIKWKCINCDMFMCDKCKEKIHVKFKFAKDHKVVSIREVGLHDKEIDFSNISCQNHTGQNYVLFCKTCDCLVCPLCISETHNGHGFVTIREGYEILIGKLKTKGKNIGTYIDELEKRKAEVKDVNNAELSKFENTLKKIKDQNIQLKKKVDQHTKTMETELIKKWEDLHRCTEKEEKDVSLLISSLASKMSEVDGIIQSIDAKKVFVDGLGLSKSIEKTVTSPGTKFDSIPTFLPGQLTAYNIGSLENVSTKGEIKAFKRFDTEISDVFSMIACSEGTLWITNFKVLQKVEIEGRRLKIINQKEINIWDIACTPSKDLLLADGGSILKQISDQTGEVTKTKYEVKGLHLSAVYVNQDGKVTVSAFNGKLVYPAVGRRVVTVMDGSGKHETIFEYDRQGRPIFSHVLSITRTKNGNIFVVNKLSADHSGRVVILSEDGDVLNTFSGNSEVNTDEILFQPLRVFTTPSDNIIISNLTHSILYFLNNSGNYIGWRNTKKVGIIYPRSFCSTEAGHTYVGCVTSEDSSDNAKIYEIIIS
ncbi:uncharacterized protein LOC127729589 [Mytilus californianus]|uniref:uncharacterized protein LOC127729589 n=1 Tax=Mytilus californianus TaxID=6549 RepID=UPI0022485F04|nr:uncharacterized protein LOC127729589 [Mytilus californianus]